MNCNCCTTYNAPDLMDGGVTCAAIEDESIAPERARSLVQERDDAERERARWQESAEAADRERHDWQVRAVKAEDRAGEYHDTIVALRTDLAIALDRAEKAEENVRSREEMINRLDARARKAETALADVHERDETVARLETRLIEAEEDRDHAEAQRDDALHSVKVLRADLERAECHDCIRDAAVIETMRPMRAEDVTGEMVGRLFRAAGQVVPGWGVSMDDCQYLLQVALTEPQRPEGAEKIEAAFGTWERSEYLHAALDEDDLRSIADHIARVVTEEQP